MKLLSCPQVPQLDYVLGDELIEQHVAANRTQLTKQNNSELFRSTRDVTITLGRIEGSVDSSVEDTLADWPA